MGALDHFEQRLESGISGLFAKLFRSAVQPVEVAAALQRECDNNAQILSRDRRLVPNVFYVELAAGDLQRLAPYDSALVTELSTGLHDHARTQNYVFPGPVSIHFEAAPDLTIGRFRIRSEALAAVTGYADHTSATTLYIEVNGSRHPIPEGGVVIGRGTDADIRVNDPGISRTHVRFSPNEAEPLRRVDITDLDSTNGMLVDGHKVRSATVSDGSRVRIGATEITVHVSRG